MNFFIAPALYAYSAPGPYVFGGTFQSPSTSLSTQLGTTSTSYTTIQGYGNGVWIAYKINSNSPGTFIRTTDNGATWTAFTIAGVASIVVSISYGNGLWIISSTTTVAAPVGIHTSTDNGVTWASGAMTGIATKGQWVVTYAGGQWVGVCRLNTATSNGTNIGVTSPDGSTWTQRSLGTVGGWGNIAHNGAGLYVAATNSNVPAATTTNSLITSPDGITWTLRTVPLAIAVNSQIAYGNGVWVIILTGTTGYLTSANGTTWTQRVLPFSGRGGVVFSGGYFIAVGPGTTGNFNFSKSLDGITWTTVAPPSGELAYSWSYLRESDFGPVMAFSGSATGVAMRTLLLT